jgi:hypothetical protein
MTSSDQSEPHDRLMLVGSCPLCDAETMMRRFGGEMGRYLAALPDGEIGERQFWVIRQHFRVFHGHKDIDTIQRPSADWEVERLIPHDRQDKWLFRVRDGVERVLFGDRGWRLGYARDAINSYSIFKLLKENSAIPEHLRFQVSVPTPNSVISNENWPNAGDLSRVRPGYIDAMASEIETICNQIPHDQLAIQFDSVWELGEAYGYFDNVPSNQAVERNTPQIASIAAAIPSGVNLGFHLCFGTFGGWPRIQAEDLRPAVEMANAFIAAAGRRVDWMHIPLPEKLNASYYAPLQELDLQGARLYLGLIHHMKIFERRLALIKSYRTDFGLAAYCGLGRVPVEDLAQAIEDHEAAVKIMEGSDQQNLSQRLLRMPS